MRSLRCFAGRWARDSPRFWSSATTHPGPSPSSCAASGSHHPSSTSFRHSPTRKSPISSRRSRLSPHSNPTLGRSGSCAGWDWSSSSCRRQRSVPTCRRGSRRRQTCSGSSGRLGFGRTSASSAGFRRTIVRRP